MAGTNFISVVCRIYSETVKITLLFPDEVEEYAVAARRIAELTLKFLRDRYGYVIDKMEVIFKRTGNFNFYARPGRVVVEYYEGAFEVESRVQRGIGERAPSSPYLIVHEVCHSAFGFCTYEGLAEALSTIVCMELGDEFGELWPTGVKVREYAEYRHRAITEIDYSDEKFRGLHFAGTYMFLTSLEEVVGGLKVGNVLKRVYARYGEISQPDVIVETCSEHPHIDELLESYGDAAMYPLVFWKHSEEWLKWRREAFMKAFSEQSVDEALKVMKSIIYRMLEYAGSTGTLTEHLADWLQALGYGFKMGHYDGERSEIIICNCPSKTGTTLIGDIEFCTACRGSFSFSDKVSVRVIKRGNYCMLEILKSRG